MRSNRASVAPRRPRLSSLCPLLLAASLGLAGLSRAIAADSPAPASQAPGKSVLDEVIAKRKELAAQIGALGKPNGGQATDADAADVSAVEDELEFLETLDGVCAQQQARLEQRQELEADKTKAVEDLESLRKFGPTDPKPYSFLLLENIRDERAAEDDHLEAFDADIKAAEQLLEAAQNHFDQSEKDRRRVQEELADNEDKEQEAALTAALQLAKRQCQIAKELIPVRRLEVEVRTLRRDVCAARKTQLEEKVELIAKDVRFTKQDLHDRLKELAEFEAELNGQIKEARARFQQTESRQAAAIQELRDARAPQSTLDLALESWRVARDTQQMQMSLLNERIGDNKRFHHYWSCRYEVENGTAKPAEIAEWHESLSDLLDEMRDNRRSLEQRIETSRSQQSKLVQRLRNNDDPAVEKLGEFQCAQWQGFRDVCETHLVQLKVNERWSGRFLEELEAKLQPADANSFWKTAEQHLATIWAYEIVEVDDRPITVGKIVTLFFYIVLGVLLASVFSRLLGRHLLPRLGLNEGASHAVRSIAFYLLAVLFGVLSFQLVHIPLAAFAFLGGAVAIAIGFGSQDIANNFMSGIILLAEQPIRVGDVVVVDSVQGTVQHIGPRSTRIRTDSNYELIVPNSKLLSDKVTNLTLSDKLVQTAVTVVLPLKISVRQAKDLLLQAAQSHPTVLEQPRPIVLFKQFGATSMEFELHFWLQLDDDMQTAIAQSEVREAINELFQQNDAPPSIVAAPSLAGSPPNASRSTKAA
jgi:potassium-dependent mechanosensitive channel